MGHKFTVECPAKVNLFLEIGEPDRSGMHPLRTEFQAVGLYDTLTVELGGSGFEVEGMDLPEENTLSKVMRLMRELATVPPLGVKLVKRIPAMAGLGGGSSDAAALLRILRRLLPRSIPDRDFLNVARSVGADVAFFLSGGHAVGEGYGDKLTPLPDDEPQWLVLAKPDEGCATADMYKKLDAARAAGPIALPQPFRHNDFHLVAPEVCLKLMRQLEELGLGAIGMTGSGSVVFGMAQSLKEAERVCNAISGNLAWVVPTITRQESLRLSESTSR